jgi:hypothetical protein
MPLSHDPEIPAGYQDADLLQADLEAAGRHIARLQARGICTHGSVIGRSASGAVIYPEQEGLEGDQLACTEQAKRADGCRRVFADQEEWHAASAEVLL